MKGYAAQLNKLDRADGSLQKRYQEQLDRWNRLSGFSQKLELQLKQLPERWKDYNQKLHGMSDWIGNVEKLMKEMGQENLSSDEYKDVLAKFQYGAGLESSSRGTVTAIPSKRAASLGLNPQGMVDVAWENRRLISHPTDVITNIT